jgi:hypothetical protein
LDTEKQAPLPIGTAALQTNHTVMSSQNPADKTSTPTNSFNPEELQSKEVKEETRKRLEQTQNPVSDSEIDPDEIARSPEKNDSSLVDDPESLSPTRMGIISPPD